jgi:beta-lactam-binding protein with PASTA domain
VSVPSLLGLSGRQALRVLQPLGLVLEPAGSGAVVRQEPEVGAAVAPGQVVRVWLEPAGGYQAPTPAAAEAAR